jgi:hypothetical protein
VARAAAPQARSIINCCRFGALTCVSRRAATVPSRSLGRAAFGLGARCAPLGARLHS